MYLEGCKKNKDFDEIENDRPQGGGECDLQQMEHVLPGTQHQKYFIYQEPSHGKNGCHGNGMCMPHKYNAPVVHHQPQFFPGQTLILQAFTGPWKQYNGMKVTLLELDKDDPIDGPKLVTAHVEHNEDEIHTHKMWVKSVHIRQDFKVGEIKRATILMEDPRPLTAFQDLFKGRKNGEEQAKKAQFYVNGQYVKEQMDTFIKKNGESAIQQDQCFNFLQDTFFNFWNLELVMEKMEAVLQALKKQPASFQTPEKAAAEGYKKVYSNAERYTPPALADALAMQMHICFKHAGITAKETYENGSLNKFKNQVDAKAPKAIQELAKRRIIFRYGWFNMLWQDIMKLERKEKWMQEHPDAEESKVKPEDYEEKFPLEGVYCKDHQHYHEYADMYLSNSMQQLLRCRTIDEAEKFMQECDQKAREARRHNHMANGHRVEEKIAEMIFGHCEPL